MQEEEQESGRRLRCRSRYTPHVAQGNHGRPSDAKQAASVVPRFWGRQTHGGPAPALPMTSAPHEVVLVARHEQPDKLRRDQLGEVPGLVGLPHSEVGAGTRLHDPMVQAGFLRNTARPAAS